MPGSLEMFAWIEIDLGKEEWRRATISRATVLKSQFTLVDSPDRLNSIIC